jgi:anti-anti-sigma regulatory factor/DNA-directed RNA polymerase subunit RPC12/RpoP
MIQVEKTMSGSVSVFKISGTIEENTNLDEALGTPQPQMEINCKGISRINSIGVKGWIKYFQNCQTKGSKLIFSECSTAIVEQINLISNFACGGKVESIYLPYSCAQCRNELAGLMKVEELKKLSMKLPALNCNKCSGKAEFDDIPEDYLAFLNR